MNKLDIVSRIVKRYLGGSAPLSTENQTGKVAQVVEWVDEAYEYILGLHNWKFQRVEFSKPLAAATRNIESPSDWKAWILKDVRSDDSELNFVEWEIFRRCCLKSAAATQTAESPSTYSIKPDGTMVFWPLSTSGNTITGEYYKTGGTLSVDSSVPIFPERYHKIIIWRALEHYAYKFIEEADLEEAKTNYRNLRRQMQLTELPPWGLAQGL